MDITYETSFGRFEWDSEKEAINLRKHGLDFKLAADVFADPFALFLCDDLHSHGEERMIVIGEVGAMVLLFVVFTERDAIRIISARKAARAEVKRYEESR